MRYINLRLSQSKPTRPQPASQLIKCRVKKNRLPKSRRHRDQPSPPRKVQLPSNSGESDDESETDDNQNDKSRPSQNRKKKRARSEKNGTYPRTASESKMVSTSSLQQPNLDEIIDIESGIEISISENVEGDTHETNSTWQDMDSHDDRAEDINHSSTSSASVTTSQMAPAKEPASLFLDENDGNITADKDLLHFPAPVQPSDSHGDETLTDGDTKQQTLQASEQQPQNGKTALVPGSAAPQSNENDWADKAHYYVAVGASRQAEKDKQIEELIEEKIKLEQMLKEMETKHAEVIKKESEERTRQVTELKEQLAEKEQELKSLLEKRDKELAAAEKRLIDEKAQQQQQLEKDKSDIEILKEKNAKLEKKIAEKSVTVEAQKQELNDIKAKIKNLEAHLEAKVKIIDEFEHKKAVELAAIKEMFKERISKLEHKLECEKQIAKEREKNLKLMSEIELLKEEQKHDKEANAFKLQIKELEKKLSDEKADNAMKENKAIKLQHQQSQTELQQMRETLQQKDKQVEELVHEIRRLSLSSTGSSEASLNVSRAATSDDQGSQLKSIDEEVKFIFDN